MLKILSLRSGSVGPHIIADPMDPDSKHWAKQSIFKIIKYWPRRRLYRWGKEWVRNEFSQLRVQVRSSRASLSSSIWNIIVSLKSYLEAAWQLEIKFPTLTMIFFRKVMLGYFLVDLVGLVLEKNLSTPTTTRKNWTLNLYFFWVRFWVERCGWYRLRGRAPRREQARGPGAAATCITSHVHLLIKGGRRSKSFSWISFIEINLQYVRYQISCKIR